MAEKPVLNKYTKAVLVLTAVLVILLILNAVLNPARTPPAIGEVRDITVPGINQPLGYKITETPKTVDGQPLLADGDKKYLIVYIDDISALSARQIENIINRAYLDAGLSESQASVILKKTPQSDLPEDYNEFDLTPPTLDILDPSTYDLPAGSVQEWPEYQGVFASFKQMAELRPDTDDYVIIPNGGDNYVVILKGEFTAGEFENFMLRVFSDAKNYKFEYRKQDDLKSWNPPE